MEGSVFGLKPPSLQFITQFDVNSARVGRRLFFVFSDFLKVSIVPWQLAVLLWQTEMTTLFIMASLILQFGRKTRRSDSLRGLEGDFCSVLVAVSGQPDEQPWCSNVRRSIQLDRYGRRATLFRDLHLGNW